MAKIGKLNRSIYRSTGYLSGTISFHNFTRWNDQWNDQKSSKQPKNIDFESIVPVFHKWND